MSGPRMEVVPMLRMKTRTKTVALVAFVAAFGLAACASKTPDNPAPVVPVAGSDVSTLVGKWQGEYSSSDSGRSGSIVFEFKSGKAGRGDVLMVPKGGYQSAPPAAGSDPLASMPQVLQISFVNADGGVVKGTMDAYHDPSCDCQVETTFVGRVTGDVIEGTYTTNPIGKASISTGRWKMTRQKSS